MFSSLRSDSTMALSTCGWVFLEVVFSLMQACESQQQLHGDGLHQEHCVRCGPRISSVVHVTMLESGGDPDTALTSAFVI